MLHTEIYNEPFNDEIEDEGFELDMEADEYSNPDEVLEVALMYLNQNKARMADRLLTLAAADQCSDHRLWLAAGISRLRQGHVRRAASAFQMATWLTGDPEAFDLLNVCNDIGI